MASMNMRRAFNSKMLTKLIRYSVLEGYYDANNDWVEGRTIRSNIWGVVKVGNKFSQFDEGEALHSEDGGQRFSNYQTLYVTDKFKVNLGDKIEFKGHYFTVLQRSDESQYGFFSYILERSTEWQP